MRRIQRFAGLAMASAVLVAAATLVAQTQASTLGTARLTRPVLANGQPLAAGTYTLRVVPDMVSAPVGQTPSESRWVEFVQGGTVRGKELATVISGAEVAAVAKGGEPASGRVRVDLLKGGDYLRVWANQGGTHFLIHLAVAK
jgi:hypothetical protein